MPPSCYSSAVLNASFSKPESRLCTHVLCAPTLTCEDTHVLQGRCHTSTPFPGAPSPHARHQVLGMVRTKDVRPRREPGLSRWQPIAEEGYSLRGARRAAQSPEAGRAAQPQRHHRCAPGSQGPVYQGLSQGLTAMAATSPAHPPAPPPPSRPQG